MRGSIAASALALLAAALPVRAGLDCALESGPRPGEEIAALKVHGAAGQAPERELDYAAERGEKVTFYVLIREWDRPTARFLRELDRATGEESAGALVVAAWLTDEVAKTREYLPRAQMSLKLERTALCVFTGDRSGPDGWNLSPDARVTAVLAAKGRAVRSWGFRSLNETDVAPLREALKKAVSS